jgi:hypothetical protein
VEEGDVLRCFVLGVLFLVGCRNTPEEVRYACLARANGAVNLPPGDSSNHEAMVRELYLRCIEMQGVSDSPLKQ